MRGQARRTIVRAACVACACATAACAADDAQKAAATPKTPEQAQWEQRVPKRMRQRPEFAYVEDRPGLPRVLLIGDSISIGYTRKREPAPKDRLARRGCLKTGGQPLRA